MQRRELAPDHITLDAIAPDIIDTLQVQVDADDAEITGRRGAIPGVLHVTSGAERALVVEVPDEEPTVFGHVRLSRPGHRRGGHGPAV